MTSFNCDLFKVRKMTYFNYDLFKVGKMTTLIMTSSKSAKWLVDLHNYLDIAYIFKISRLK